MITVSIKIIFIFGSVIYAQKELQFTSSSKLKSRVLFGSPNDISVQCTIKGFTGDTLKDVLVITDDKDQPVCKGSNASEKCVWKSSGIDGDSILSYTPSISGNYTCKCDKACVAPNAKPSLLVYLVTDQRISIISPDSQDKILDLEALKVANKTSFTLSCVLPNSSTDTSLWSIKWYKNGQLLQQDSHHTFNNTDMTVIFNINNKYPQDNSRYSGTYMCEVGTATGTDSPMRAFYRVSGLPWIRNMAVSQNKVEGESVTITCQFEGEPAPQVTWAKVDGVLPSDRISSGILGLSTSSLTIENLVPEDYGQYVCKGSSIITGEIYVNATTLLRVRSKLAPLWPFLGILAELAILAAIIIIHEKKCAKKEDDEENDDGTAERKRSPTDSNNEDEGLRRRKD